MGRPKIWGSRLAVLSALLALSGIALLFFMSETPSKSSVGSALTSQENALVELTGQAKNVTADKFLLCQAICISVRGNGLPSAALLKEGRWATVQGRVKEYQGNRYIEAESIGIDWNYER